MKIIKIEIVERDPTKLKFDSSQPRKKINKKNIFILAESLKRNGFINLIEIDKNDIILTGEIRTHAAIKANLNPIPCKLITEINESEKAERQLAENILRSELTSKEKEDFIQKLWNSGEYNTQKKLGESIGFSQSQIANILRAKNTRDELNDELNDENFTNNISSKTLQNVSTLPIKDQIEIVNDVVKGRISKTQVITEVKKKKLLQKERKKIQQIQMGKIKDIKIQELTISINSTIKTIKNTKTKIFERFKLLKKYSEFKEIKTNDIEIWIQKLIEEYDTIISPIFEKIVKDEKLVERLSRKLESMIGLIKSEHIEFCPFCLNKNINYEDIKNQFISYSTDLIKFKMKKTKSNKKKNFIKNEIKFLNMLNKKLEIQKELLKNNKKELKRWKKYENKN